MQNNIAVIVGSLRQDSLNKRLARALERLAEGKLAFTHVEIGDLPHYNEDLWANPPAPVTRMKQQIEAADGVLIVTPEYNRGFPGVIKNAMDWGSRPYGKNSFAGKPAAVTGASPGKVGTAVAQSHLRSMMVHMSMVVMNQPEAYVQWVEADHGKDGEITNPDTAKFLTGFVDALATWVDRR